jgi:transcription antitermination factor NusG
MLRSTFSGRKKRVSSIPVFPGYLFVKGNYNKQSFIDSSCVCYVLKPRSVFEEKTLDQQLRSVWQALEGTEDIERETGYTDGDRIQIMSGPMKGVSGTLVCSNQSRKVTVWVDILGVGVSVKLSPDTEMMKYNSPMTR